MYDFNAMIEAVETASAIGCGLSDTLQEARVQAAYSGILARAPDKLKTVTETALKARGFDPDFDSYCAGPGECSLTGIDVNCCSCGRHP